MACLIVSSLISYSSLHLSSPHFLFYLYHSTQVLISLLNLSHSTQVLIFLFYLSNSSPCLTSLQVLFSLHSSTYVTPFKYAYLISLPISFQFGPFFHFTPVYILLFTYLTEIPTSHLYLFTPLRTLPPTSTYCISLH